MIDQHITARARAVRLATIRDELLVRIQPFCTGMSQEIFLELVDAMAAVQLKYEVRSIRPVSL